LNVVADAGPLIALAKIGGLDVLFRLFPKIQIPPAVYREAISTGLDRREPDALALEARCRAGHLELAEVPEAALPIAARLGRGEVEAIVLAIQKRAAWILIDDLAARQAEERSFQAARIAIGVKGTLGVIVSAFRAGQVSAQEGIELVAVIGSRPDIWVHERLCRQVIELLERTAV
jgi:predicted nucleic acid-binding protein